MLGKEKLRRLGVVLVVFGVVFLPIVLVYLKNQLYLLFIPLLSILIGFSVIAAVQLKRILMDRKKLSKKFKAIPTITCRGCTTEVPANLQFCVMCGKPTPPDIIQCEFCGKLISLDWPVCNSCGSPNYACNEPHFYAQSSNGSESTSLIHSINP